jgi:hypothetical protein
MNAPPTFLATWPAMMKRKTASAYLDISEAAFEREVLAGRLPSSVTIGGREHWRRDAIDKALDYLTGDLEREEEVPSYRRELLDRYGS